MKVSNHQRLEVQLWRDRASQRPHYRAIHHLDLATLLLLYLPLSPSCFDYLQDSRHGVNLPISTSSCIFQIYCLLFMTLHFLLFFSLLINHIAPAIQVPQSLLLAFKSAYQRPGLCLLASCFASASKLTIAHICWIATAVD